MAVAVRNIDCEVRVALLRAFLARGRAPGIEEVAADTGLAPHEVAEAYGRLASQGLIALDPRGHDVWMASPFSAVPTAFRVATPAGEFFANCALDSLGGIAMLGSEGFLRTRCPACWEPIEVDVEAGVPAADPGTVVHVAIPPARWCGEVALACQTMSLFHSPEHLDGWLADTGSPRGAVLSVEQAWALARAWYPHRSDPGWEPPTRHDLVALFESLGLDGPFWRV